MDFFCAVDASSCWHHAGTVFSVSYREGPEWNIVGFAGQRSLPFKAAIDGRERNGHDHVPIKVHSQDRH